jgi:tetratricopeptide (TPR) repeat protein
MTKLRRSPLNVIRPTLADSRARHYVLCATVIALLSFAAALAQDSRPDRASEWQNHLPPVTEFTRVADEVNGVIFRAPATWKREPVPKTQGREASYRFIGPHESVLQVSIEKIPDGLPLQSYTAQILQQLRNLPGTEDSVAVRQADMAGLEAREIMFNLTDETGVPTRRLIWCAVDGPVAVGIVFIEAENHIAELEPYFRAVIDSFTIYDPRKLATFEASRLAAVKESKPARLDEVQSLVNRINGLDPGARSTATDRLAALFVNTPDVCVDLVVNRRPIIRAAAIEAIARSKNHALDPFLVTALHDPELFVAEKAGRALAALPNVVALLREETLSYLSTELLARVWPFLDRKTQVQILNEVFVPPTQAPARAPARATGRRPVTIEYSDPSAQLGLLSLLLDVPQQDFKLPLAAILKSQSTTITSAAALQVALARGETVPYNELFKLLSSPDVEVTRLAAKNLGESATVANIAQLEEMAGVLSGQVAGSVRAAPSQEPVANENGIALATEIRVSIKKIRLRNQLLTTTAEQKAKLLADAGTDPQLADWIWTRYLGSQSESSSAPATGNNLSISSLGENAFPRQVTHYVSIPNPSSLVDKFGSSLKNIQMDSARAQANLVLVLTGFDRLFRQQVGAPAEGAALNYTGIKTDAPLSAGSWLAADAPPGSAAAQRKAIVLHVSDRDRFERSLGLYQRAIGSFSSLPDGVAIGARFLPIFPLVFPMSANLMSNDMPHLESETILKYHFAGQTEVDGYAVKWFSSRRISVHGIISNDAAYLAYLGEATILTPDLASMRDVLHRLRTGGPALDQNQQFKAMRERAGEAFYFSSLNELFRQPGARTDLRIDEEGGLQISNSDWESSYRVSLDDGNWSKPLISFKPDELAAPRELLPRSALMYYFMKMNGAQALRDWSGLLSPSEIKSVGEMWAADFEKEVLPEFDSECGVALLDVPDFAKNGWTGHWVLFFKLKSDRLPRLLNEGRLLKGTTVNQVGKFTFDSTQFYLTARNGFLLVSTTPESFALLESKEKLVMSPDFGKVVKHSPEAVVAFGGYNLEATNGLATANPDSVKAQQANVILSLVRAFHSPSFYATIDGKQVEARSSISMDREGRYSVAELQSLTANSEPTFAILRPRGLPIANQANLNSLKLLIQTKAAGEIDRIVEDLSSKFQTVETRSEKALQLRVLPRHAEPKQRLQLPVTASEAAAFLTPSKDIPDNDKSVANKAREIAGADRDAWSVARKLADWTYRNVTWKRVDYADAAQTLATREADCYEFSKLYVAMARSLGLPARVVSGMAYGDGSFGGHAWVEVYVGDWVEIDPTWGTSFVDATHIKDSTGALLTYAALDLVQLEVLDAPHSVADFQKDPAMLTKKICDELAGGRSDVLRSSLDVSAITDELMGAGTWSAMSDRERDQMSGSYTRVVNSLAQRLSSTRPRVASSRFLKIDVLGDRAEALVMSTAADYTEDLLRLTLVKRGEPWTLVEVLEVDTGLKMVSENLQPTINDLRAHRSGNQSPGVAQTDFARVVILMQKNNQTALSLVEKLLKDQPQNQSLRYLQSLCLTNLGKHDEATKIWAALSETQPPIAPALRRLGEHYLAAEKDDERKKAVDPLKRYISFEPDDPRAHTGLARAYESEQDFAAAETEYRAAIERDRSNVTVYLDLAEFYSEQKRFNESVSIIKEAQKLTSEKDDLFGELMDRFWFMDQLDVPDGLAASQPQLMARSFRANITLAQMRIGANRYRDALPLLKKAAALDNKSSAPYDSMAEAFRKLHEWIAALNAADTAVRLSSDDADAHYQRACVLARLGRRSEAIAALKRALELDEDMIESLEEEEDLKPLANLPEFRKLLPKTDQP